MKNGNPAVSASQCPCWTRILYFLATVVAGEALLVCPMTARAESPVQEFVQAYRCMIVEHLLAIHERGNRSKPENRYFNLAATYHPQRFVQCIFHDIDTTLLCEASSGRYGPVAGNRHALQISPEAAVVLARLGFAEPYGKANYSQEIALGDPADFEGTAELLLQTMYEVYGARIGVSMGLTAPLLGSGVTKVERCKPLS